MAVPVKHTDNGGVFGDIVRMKDFKLPSDCRIIDLEGKYVMPGLINTHVHLFSSGGPVKSMPVGSAQKLIFAAANSSLGKKTLRNLMKSRLEALLNSGVTTARCVGDFFYQDIILRDLIESGEVLGPRIKVSGHMISVTGGHGAPYLSMTADTPEEGIALVRKNAAQNVDLIKICVTGGVSDAKAVGDAGKVQMSLREASAICDEAHKFGLPVAAHAQSAEGVRIALKAGVDTIEHGSPMDDEIISLFKNNPRALKGHSYLVPTIEAGIPGMMDRKITGFSDILFENYNAVLSGMLQGYCQAAASGIKIGMGTDAAMPYVTHYNTWRELDYAIKYAGISPWLALKIATIDSAELMGLEDITGTVESGKSADFIVLASNPVQDISVLGSPLMVASRGNLIERPRVRKDKKVDSSLDSIK
ncbi:MAG: amidohydrolase family protein [Clostridiales bacterium]|nr:amidohydrolase family protein [Clostridiales bacterium]